MDPPPTSPATVAGAPAQRSAPALGLAIAFGGAALYTLATICATLSYAEGANPATVIWLRFLFASLTLGLMIVVLRRSFRVERRARPALLGTALGMMGMTNGYMTAIAFIPIELAVLIFYTFPLLVGAVEARLERRSVGAFGLLLYLLAFGGLALALGPSFADLDWRGLALAALASASGVVTLLCSRSVVRQLEPMAIAFHANLLGFAVMCAILPALSELATPATAFGWTTLVLACSIFIVGFFCQILAVRLARAGPVAMMYNLEPALTVVIAWSLLGADFSLAQAVGVLLVLIALVLAPRAMAR